MQKKVVVWGAAGHAKVAADILRRMEYDVVGFIDEVEPGRQGELFFSSTVLGGADVVESLLARGVRRAFVGFGNNLRRLLVGERLASCGFELVQAIHPTAVLGSEVALGAGSMLAAGAIINPSTSIGNHVIVNTRASVDHDCVVEDGAHVGPGVTLGGHVHVGRAAWIGIGATILDHKCIGAGAIVGGGAVVVDDIPEDVVVVGVPAKILKRVS